MRHYVIYRDTTDYPGRFVVRGWTVADGEMEADPEPLAVVEDIYDARAAVPRQYDVMTVRHPDDDPTIVEVWM